MIGGIDIMFPFPSTIKGYLSKSFRSFAYFSPLSCFSSISFNVRFSVESNGMNFTSSGFPAL